ncbi:hypothetical protein chiPu_0009118 [Chiloscyllium punctatum]|uniref:Uncharacterized protein n=1 Tax=Chiloscyllium punctatum TaxID=137246 RepID=A0A401SJY0_CHIPU|nr:hypothetical protein [Chiloscyllium punctatum]
METVDTLVVILQRKEGKKGNYKPVNFISITWDWLFVAPHFPPPPSRYRWCLLNHRENGCAREQLIHPRALPPPFCIPHTAVYCVGGILSRGRTPLSDFNKQETRTER